MRKILMLVIVLLVLGGGGGGAYYYFVMMPAAAQAAAEGGEGHEEGGEEAKKEDAHGEEGGDGHGEKSQTEFVELDPLILPIVDNDGVSQVVSLVVAIEVADPTSKDKVKAMSPKLKDAYIQDMYGMLNQHAAMKGGIVQVAIIKQRLNEVTNTVLGDDVAQDVLLLLPAAAVSPILLK